MATGLIPPIWPFLAPSRFAVKTASGAYWISLDFLGFSGLNRYSSMGYTGFSLKENSRVVCLRIEPRKRTAADEAMQWQTCSCGKLSFISDFTQLIVTIPVRRNQIAR
jgi:hypothetical protein